MPKLDLTVARQIKGPWSETLALKGPGYVWAKPATGPAWVYPVFRDSGVAVNRGVVTQDPDGSYRVTTAPGPGNNNGRCEFSVPSNTPVRIETVIAFDQATRLLLRSVTSSADGAGTNQYDVTRPSPGAVLTRSDTITSPTMLLHIIGITSGGQYFTIKPQMRFRVL